MYSRVYVEITNICNKSCSFCPGHERNPEMMNKEQFEVILERLEDVTKYIYYHLMGEPLLHPDLPCFIKMANQRGFLSAVTTNGSFIGDVGDALIDAGVYKVNISVHSFEDEDSEGLEKYINSCVEFADKASRAGVLVVFRLWNNGCDNGRNEYIVDLLKQRFCNDEWKESDRGARIRHKLHLEYGDRFSWPDMSAEEGDDRMFCYGLSDHFSVLCDGTVVPCCLDRNGELALGNAFEESIESILSGKKAKDISDGFKRHIAVEELCRKCGYARRFKV